LDGLGDKKNKVIAIDNIGAGIGEVVLVATGSAARIGCNMENAPVDAAIVGIVDDGIGISGDIKK
ncbi:MAG: EutN/CcmL family microcompartment protein, partial [Clostridia bacterium]|nr:EutN/CcmL family microcompartment protein [Clostridia bacterium]